MTPAELLNLATKLQEAVNMIVATVPNEPDPEPAWPTAPHVWWEGEVWVRGDDGEYQTAGDYWAKSHLRGRGRVRDGARRFVREAIPVTIVPTREWERLRDCEEPAWLAAEALVDATEALNGETNE